jgi:uncharacterized protein
MRAVFVEPLSAPSSVHAKVRNIAGQNPGRSCDAPLFFERCVREAAPALSPDCIAMLHRDFLQTTHRSTPLSHAHVSTSAESVAIDRELQAFFNQVYTRMFFAMVITGAISYIFGTDLAILLDGGEPQYVPKSVLEFMYSPIVFIMICFSPLVFLLLGGGLVKSSGSPLAAKIGLYTLATLFGLSVATIFVEYTGMSIAQTFAGSAAAFAAMSIFGHTTSRDLSAMGRFMMMALIGLIVVMILNLFIGSEPLSMLISAAGVVIFAGLTAWDTQKLKNSFLAARGEDEAHISSLATFGALELYLDFINLFLHMLRLLGTRR